MPDVPVVDANSAFVIDALLAQVVVASTAAAPVIAGTSNTTMQMTQRSTGTRPRKKKSNLFSLFMRLFQ
jgi:hypothetical protein